MKVPSYAQRWNNRALLRLCWPLVVEQILAVSIGMVDTVMVSGVGESAVSGVALVDAVNVLLINAFTALATGGAVVAGQYLGRRDTKSASQAGCQLLYTIAAASLGVMVLALALQHGILRLVYGHIAPDVMQNANTYLWLSALSYPFIGLYNAGAALFRSMGNSKMGMAVAFMVNLLNIGGNALLIFGLGMGVAGAALATLVSRAAAALVLVWALMRPGAGPISLEKLFRTRPDAAMIKSILRIGLPNGMESSTFQVGKLMVARIISTFGTAAIAGNAMANVITSICTLFGQSFGLAALTVVAQCAGAGDYAGAKLNTRKLMGASYVAMTFFSLVLGLLRVPLPGLFNLSDEAARLAARLLLIFSLWAPLLWTPSFSLPSALRAVGDVRYNLVVSLASMWIFRIGLCYLLTYGLGLGVEGVWYAMIVDWAVRSACFVLRWWRGKWQKQTVLKKTA